MKATETIVLQVFTRDITKIRNIEAYYKRYYTLISKAKKKAKKVVISTVVYREDVQNIRRPIDLINAYFYYKYDADDDVIICDNSKLNSAEFRFEDHLYLNDAETSVLASNLKYSIAASLNIKVLKKDFVVK